MKRFVLGAWLLVATTGLAAGGPYEEGLWADQLGDHTRAAKQYRSAAEQGHSDAQFYLGHSYSEGRGVPKDYVKGAKWYRSAAEQGHGGAQLKLAFAYYTSQGVPQDLVLAHMWSNLAAAQGTSLAAQFRDAVANEMTRDQIAEAQRMTREWRPKK